MNEPENRLRNIFAEAIEIEDAQQRAAFLSEACGEDAVLRREVEELIQAEAVAGRFLPRHPGEAEVGASPPAAANAQEAGDSKGRDLVTEKPGDKIGRYKLLQKIGEGGCGIVYMAQQETPVKRKVALKVIKLGMDTRSVVARFEAERQALALMDHPNIAKVLDAGATDAGRPYFVMELVRGTKITNYCDEQRLSMHQRLDLFIQVCQAVQHAHQKGIIHRDLKPSNILVTERDGQPVPKVIDFGIAKATGDVQLTDKTLFTAFEQFIGTPAYMSPEQARLGEVDIDTRTDIYSLGVLLYELMTGRPPFETKALRAAGLNEMLRRIRDREPAKPSTRISGVSASQLTTAAQARSTDPVKLVRMLRGDLDWIVMKALEKDRTRRYETANGLAADVERYLSNEPIVARPPSRIYHFQKLVRRNKLPFVAAGASIAFLAVGFGVSTFLFFREREARRRAVAAEQAESRARWQSEISGNLASAGLALYKRDFEKADTLMSQIPISLLETYMESNPSTNAWQALSLLGGWHASRQEWRAGIFAYEEAAAISKNNFPLLNQGASCQGLAALLVQAGDLEAYRHLCRTIIAGSAGTTDPNIADRAAKACLILADLGIDLAAVRKLVETATALGATSRYRQYSDYFLATKGWLEYREGRFVDAMDSTRGSLADNASVEDGCRVEAYMVLAMAQQKLKKTNDANEALASGRALARTMPEPKFEGRGFWVDWIIGHFLMREATATFEGFPKTGEADALDDRKQAQ